MFASAGVWRVILTALLPTITIPRLPPSVSSTARPFSYTGAPIPPWTRPFQVRSLAAHDDRRRSVPCSRPPGLSSTPKLHTNIGRLHSSTLTDCPSAHSTPSAVLLLLSLHFSSSKRSRILASTLLAVACTPPAEDCGGRISFRPEVSSRLFYTSQPLGRSH